MTESQGPENVLIYVFRDRLLASATFVGLGPSPSEVAAAVGEAVEEAVSAGPPGTICVAVKRARSVEDLDAVAMDPADAGAVFREVFSS